ncbi:hypothetical protein LTR17_010887 [Elasticomyces elasticus]|nr:hypothetical protein LTR17_010887 [Elasticomyces elasticus]
MAELWHKRSASAVEPDTRLAKRMKSSYIDLITVLAGSEEAPFAVHEESLCYQSPFFAAACHREWKEGEEKTVRVPTVEPDTFELYAHWVYRGEINLELVPLLDRTAEDKKYGPRLETTQTHKDDVEQLIKLYVAADMLLDEYLKNKVVDELVGFSLDWDGGNLCIEPYHIEHLYAHTSGESLLRLLIVYSVTSTMGREDLERFNGMRCANEFLYDLAAHQLDLRRNANCYHTLTWLKRCDYHYHGSDWDWDRCKDEDSKG